MILSPSPQEIANFMLNDFTGLLRSRKYTFANSPIAPAQLRLAVTLIKNGVATKQTVRQAIGEMLDK